MAMACLPGLNRWDTGAGSDSAGSLCDPVLSVNPSPDENREGDSPLGLDQSKWIALSAPSGTSGTAGAIRSHSSFSNENSAMRTPPPASGR